MTAATTTKEPAVGDEASGTRRAPRRAALATLVGACVHVYLQVQMLLGLPNFSLRHFKWFYPIDQLSSLSIVVNVAHGRSASTEPMTETGVSHYPRLYYVTMGLLSRVTGIEPVTMWWVMGLTLQFILAALIGWALYTTTRLWWAAALAPLPFLIGTFAAVLDDDFLARTAAGGRVMWGPFAQIFALNGGAAGITIGCSAVLGLIIVGWNGFRSRATLLVGIGVALCAGVAGNIQTYSFIGLCYVLLYGTAVYGLQSPEARRRRWLWAASGALMAAILLAGTTLADHVGPLPVFVLGLLPALPGYVVVCRQTSWRLLWLSLAATALAMPTLVSTMRGLAQGDPFLLYRQASTAAVGPRFGMPLSSFVVHGGVAVLLVLIVSVAPHPRSRLMRSVALGAFLSWFLLANNDNWGPSQEPNRFWIDGYMLILVTGFPLLAAVALDTIRRAWASPRKVGAGVMSVALVLWVGAAVTSAQDWLLFNEAARSKGISWWPSPRSEAIASVVSRMPREGIVVTDRCTDLLSVKAITGARVAFYNYGLAWPDNHIAITAVQKGREFRWLDPRVAREAGVGYLLTDSHCKMPRNTDGNVDLVASGQYVDPAGRTATLRLWKIRW